MQTPVTYAALLLIVPNFLQFLKNAGMLDCPASGQLGTRIKKLLIPYRIRYRNKDIPVQYRNATEYRTEMLNAGIPLLDADAQLRSFEFPVLQAMKDL
jgi:hypothetical protein